MSSEGQGPPPAPGWGAQPGSGQPEPGPPPPPGPYQAPPGQYQAPPGQPPPPNWGPPPPNWGAPPPPPYGYGYPPPQPYGPVPRAPQNEGTAITALVLSIASFPLSFMCGIGVIAAIVSLALCPSARRKIEASGGALTGESMLTAAKIVSWINIGLTALVVVFIGIGFAAGWWEDDSYEYSLRLALAFPS